MALIRPAIILLLSAPAWAGLALAQDTTNLTPPQKNYLDVEVDSEPHSPRLSYALGLSINSAPEYAGSDRRDYSLKPAFAIRYGRYKLSSSGGSSILNFGERAESSGASADLINNKTLKLKASARIGGGRNADDSVDFDGLPEVDRTIFGRLSASYQLSSHFNLNSTLTTDLLGRDNGTTLSAGLSYTQRISSRTEWNAGIGVTYGDATHMRSFYGVPDDAANAQRSAYSPGAGFKDWGIGTGFMTALDKHWIAFGSAGYNQLIGRAFKIFT